jgi:hypothetical protein
VRRSPRKVGNPRRGSALAPLRVGAQYHRIRGATKRPERNGLLYPTRSPIRVKPAASMAASRCAASRPVRQPPRMPGRTARLRRCTSWDPPPGRARTNGTTISGRAARVRVVGSLLPKRDRSTRQLFVLAWGLKDALSSPGAAIALRPASDAKDQKSQVLLERLRRCRKRAGIGQPVEDGRRGSRY